MQDKLPRNEKKQPHGRWEIYYPSNSWWKAHYVNGVELGFSEYWHSDSSKRIPNEYYAR